MRTLLNHLPTPQPTTAHSTASNRPNRLRYGLRNLAESNLLDLIASARHHAKTSQRIRWFAQFACAFQGRVDVCSAGLPSLPVRCVGGQSDGRKIGHGLAWPGLAA
jgi:hypothetical protein